MFLVSRSQ